MTALIHDEATAICVKAERALLKALEGGCQVPIGALAEIQGNQIYLRGIVGSLNGKILLKDQETGSIETPEQIGMTLAQRFLDNGAQQILDSIRQELAQ